MSLFVEVADDDTHAIVLDPPGLQGNDVAVLRDGRMIEISQLPPNAVVEGFVHPSAMGRIKGRSTLTGLDPGNSTAVTTMQYSFPWGGTNDNKAGNCNVVGR